MLTFIGLSCYSIRNMSACRSLTESEIKRVLKWLADKLRDRALFVTGLRTGFRISEILSLRVRDVQDENGRIKDKITVLREFMKGLAVKKKSRTVAVHPDVKIALKEYITEAELKPDDYLFPNPKGEKALSRFQAWRILKDAYSACGLKGKLATHTMRKTFANKVYRMFNGNILKTAKALGHDRSMNTERYLEVRQEEIDNAITGVA